MATNVIKEFLSIIQKMSEVWRTTQSRDQYSTYNKTYLIHFQPELHKENDKVIKAKPSKKVMNVKTSLLHFYNENDKHQGKNIIKMNQSKDKVSGPWYV